MALAFMGLIWLGSSVQLPGTLPGVGRVEPLAVLAHLTEYSILGVLLSKASWPLGILYGPLDELHQAFVPMRTASFGDAFVDVMAAALLYVLIKNRAWDTESS